jgi:hypothetical protein
MTASDQRIFGADPRWEPNTEQTPARSSKRVITSTRTGIWHEPYLVRAGEYEAIYGNMPPFGLRKAGRLVPLADAETAGADPAAASGAVGQSD